jgi:hypothetical protein
MSGPPVLRPMDYAELFNEGFDLYKRNFVLFTGIVAVVLIPYSLLSSLAGNSTWLSVLVAVIGYLPIVAASGAIVKAMADRYLGRETSIADAWRYVTRRTIPFLLTSMLGGLLVLGGMILFCVPGIIVAFWIFFLWSVMVVEDRYFRDAIARCRELAAGQYARILVIWVLTAFLYFGASLIMGLLIALPMIWMGTGAGVVALPIRVLQGVLTGVLQSVVTPLATVLSVLLYFDIRVRKEGFDIELLARDMGESAPGAGPAY